MKRRPIIAAIASAGLVTGAAVALSQAAPGPDWYTGTLPSGASYAFEVTSGDREICQVLTVTGEDADGSTENCQDTHGPEAIAGMWALDCKTGDLRVHGSSDPAVASVRVSSDRGSSTSGDLDHRDGGGVFLVVADGAKLPGRIEALNAAGAVLRSIELDSADALCSNAPVPNPLEVSYPF